MHASPSCINQATHASPLPAIGRSSYPPSIGGLEVRATSRTAIVSPGQGASLGQPRVPNPGQRGTVIAGNGPPPASHREPTPSVQSPEQRANAIAFDPPRSSAHALTRPDA